MASSAYCLSCGAPLSEEDAFCGTCGYAVEASRSPSSAPDAAPSAPAPAPAEPPPAAPPPPPPPPPAPGVAPVVATGSGGTGSGHRPPWLLPAALGAVVLAVVALILVLLAGGGSSESTKERSTQPATTLAREPDAGSTASSSPDRQIARASTLRISDFPAGWTTSRHTESPPSQLPQCAPTVAAEKEAKPYKVVAPNFGLSSGGTRTVQVTNVVYVFPSVAQATEYLAAFQLPTAQECLQARLDEATEGSSVQASVTALDVSDSLADDAAGLAATVPSSLDTVYYEEVAFRVGRGVTALTRTNLEAPFPDTSSLAAISIARLKTNLDMG